MTDEEIREICESHGWNFERFMEQYNRLMDKYGSNPDAALARAQRDFAKKNGLKKLKSIAPQARLEQGGVIPPQVQPPTPSGGGGREAGKGTKEPDTPQPAAKDPPEGKGSAYDRLIELVGNDIVEIYGDEGTGKSRLIGHIALEAQERGKRVLFLDNENSLPKTIAARLKNYEYVGMQLQPLVGKITNLKPDFDLICIDSIGFPVLCNYFELGLKERLTALGKMILLRAHLKEYAVRNKALAIATNQPISEFSYSEMSPHPIPKTEILPPFGGKGAFISKLILHTEIIERGDRTRIGLHTYKARDLPFDKRIAEFVITSTGTELRWL